MQRFGMAFALVLAGAGLAEAGSVARGETLYHRHCATCHGIDMMGQGPMAGVLVIKPSDLTALAAGGEFPTEVVIKKIDGRDPLVSHGSPMPVYGPFFEGLDRTVKLPDGATMMTSQAVLDLLAYIQSVQN